MYKMVLLTKSKFLLGRQCFKLLWNAVHNKDQMPEPSEEAKYRMAVGTEVGLLAQKLFPDGVSIPSDDFMGNIKESQENLSLGVPLFEAGFMVNNLFSRVDVLRPNQDGSWDIIEVKSGTQVKEENVQDVAFQQHVLELSGLKVNKTFLCFINNQYVRQGDLEIEKLFTIQDISQEVSDALDLLPGYVKEMLDMLKEYSEEYPELIGLKCDKPYTCPLKDRCWTDMPKNNVYTLYRGGKTSEKLFENGFNAISEIPEGTKLTTNQLIQLQCEKTGKPHIQSFEIKQFIDSLEYPISYLDFETINPAIPKFDGMKPYQRIPFQYSLHIEQEDGSIEHKEFLAEWRDDPREDFLKSLQRNLNKKGSVLVYNQAFEAAVLRELASAFPEYADWVNDILPRVADLLIPFRNFHYYNPIQKGSASIKKVLPALTDLSYDDMVIAGGSDASSSFERITYTDVPEDERIKVREALLKYCELDTWAEVLILKKLKEQIRLDLD